MRRFAIAACAILSAAAAAAFSWTSTPTIQVESAALNGLASLSVRCETRGAEVWLDYQYRGTAPLDLTGLAPGPHALALRADGYYEAVITLSLAADTKTTVTASLQLRTGYLDVRVSPRSATVAVDGESYAPGVIEVAAGQKTVTIKAFGYTEQTHSIYVPERLVASISATLEPASFEASGFRLSGDRFNPRNAGLRGQAGVSFSVTAPGYAELRVTAPDGSLAHSDRIGPFEDWEQSLSWDGRDGSGGFAPDGEYTVELAVRPDDAVESELDEYVFSASLRVDSSLVIVPSGSFGAMFGSARAPDALPPAASAFRAEASAYAAGAFGSAAATGGAALSVSAAVAPHFDVGAGLEIAGFESGAGRLGARLSTDIGGAFAAAVLADGRIAEATDGDPAWARIGASIGVGTPFLNAVAMPAIAAYWEDGFSMRAGLGAAFSLSGYSLGASLSASALSGPLSDGLAPDWPVGTTLELRFMPAGLPLTFRLSGGLDWSPAPSGWNLGLAVSGGF